MRTDLRHNAPWCHLLSEPLGDADVVGVYNEMAWVAWAACMSCRWQAVSDAHSRASLTVESLC